MFGLEQSHRRTEEDNQAIHPLLRAATHDFDFEFEQTQELLHQQRPRRQRMLEKLVLTGRNASSCP